MASKERSGDPTAERLMPPNREILPEFRTRSRLLITREEHTLKPARLCSAQSRGLVLGLQSLQKGVSLSLLLPQGTAGLLSASPCTVSSFFICP